MLLKKVFTNPSLYLFVLFFQLSVAAADVEVSPILGYRTGGTFVDLDSSVTLTLDETDTQGVIVDIDYGKAQQISLLYSRQATDLLTSDPNVTNPLLSMNVEYIHFGGNKIWVEDKLRTFLGATIGATHFSATGQNSTTRFSFSLAGGSKYFLSENIALMVGLRGYATLFNSASSLFCGNSGCLIRVAGQSMLQVEAMAGVTFRF